MLGTALLSWWRRSLSSGQTCRPTAPPHRPSLLWRSPENQPEKHLISFSKTSVQTALDEAHFCLLSTQLHVPELSSFILYTQLSLLLIFPHTFLEVAPDLHISNIVSWSTETFFLPFMITRFTLQRTFRQRDKKHAMMKRIVERFWYLGQTFTLVKVLWWFCHTLLLNTKIRSTFININCTVLMLWTKTLTL